MGDSIEDLKKEYEETAHLAERFSVALQEQLEELFLVNKISLGVQIERRVKSWNSIAEKLERKSLEIESIGEISDLVGLRLILLFKRDVLKTCELLSESFSVLEKEDTQEKLGESQFGYQSFHYLIKMPKGWLSVPSLAPFEALQAEIQIRTVAQHIWAAASHALQYKHESSIPPPILRTINRVSAILETVDLEFERVLEEREVYVSDVDLDATPEPLNVDILEKILDSLFPQENKIDDETYADLLPDLIEFKIERSDQLQELIKKNLNATINKDAKTARGLREKDPEYAHYVVKRERKNKNVFFSHVGLMRSALEFEFGPKWINYRKSK